MMAIFSFVMYAQQEQVQNGAHTMRLIKVAMDKLDEIKKQNISTRMGKTKRFGTMILPFSMWILAIGHGMFSMM